MGLGEWGVYGRRNSVRRFLFFFFRSESPCHDSNDHLWFFSPLLSFLCSFSTTSFFCTSGNAGYACVISSDRGMVSIHRKRLKRRPTTDRCIQPTSRCPPRQGLGALSLLRRHAPACLVVRTPPSVD